MASAEVEVEDSHSGLLSTHIALDRTLSDSGSLDTVVAEAGEPCNLANTLTSGSVHLEVLIVGGLLYSSLSMVTRSEWASSRPLMQRYASRSHSTLQHQDPCTHCSRSTARAMDGEPCA